MGNNESKMGRYAEFTRVELEALGHPRVYSLTTGGNVHSFSNFLFARPGWLSGVARVLDLGGFYDTYNYSPAPMADTLALYSDWRTVGHDLRAGLEAARSWDTQLTLFPPDQLHPFK